MDSIFFYTFFAASGLAFVHVFAGRLRFLEGIPRSKWLSGAGGVSVAYVFIHIFPELNEGQEKLKEILSSTFSFLQHHVYLLALLGFISFYSLERFVKTFGSHKKTVEKGENHNSGVFWVHIVSFSIYNALIGYLLVHREDEELSSVLIFFLAMALHFVVNDYGLREHHKESYDKIGRWVLGAAVLGGWLAGTRLNIDVRLVTTLFAILAGAIILNVMKEELPEERKSSATSFFFGAIGYAVLLLTI